MCPNYAGYAEAYITHPTQSRHRTLYNTNNIIIDNNNMVNTSSHILTYLPCVTEKYTYMCLDV